jgi:alpha-ketoglutarate-dependent taurine dioxygenase/1,4-dihydroxy-2-naphthoate octaprenyltransferase
VIASEVRLEPFGVRFEFVPGTRFADLDADQLKRWVDEHRVVQLRGLVLEPAHRLAAQCRRLGPLQPWSFGAVHELKQVAGTENYLYTDHAVPLHWDGAFADAVPHWLVFACLAAPPAGAGGETVFVDTTTVLANASAQQRQAWEGVRIRYTTERKAHYGGSFVSPIVARHPTSGVPVIRFAEPVDDLNPVTVAPVGLSPEDGRQLVAGLARALADPRAALSLPWRAGDHVIADNHALLHGRRAFRTGAPRHLLRVNVLDAEHRWWARWRASWRVRRPEFFRAELPILLIPALVCAPDPAALASLPFIAAVTLFFLLFNVGDMINCWWDRDVDLHRKTHLAEAIALVGRRSLLLQIVGSALAAVALGAYLAWTLQRWWLAPAGLVGVLLAASYTAPPLRLKSRGLWQLIAYAGLLFVGPMAMIAGVFQAHPSASLLMLALGFGIMQTGTLLVNTAEDLDEDERERIRTAAVVLQARGTIQTARLLVLGGAALFLSTLALDMPAPWWLSLVPLLVAAVANERWLAGIARRQRDQGEAGRRQEIRAQGKHVPRRIELCAWLALLAAAGHCLSRMG